MRKTLTSLGIGIAFFCLCFFAVAVHAESAGDTSLRNRIRIQKRSHLTTQHEDSEEFNSEKMNVLEKKRRALILDIKRFIREASSEDQKTELNLRLGGLYLEDYHAGLAQAQLIYEKEMADYNQKKTARKKPKLDTSEANASLERARSIYKDLVNRYPHHPRRDEMLYFLALSSLDKGNMGDGMNYFKRLTEETPHSKYVHESLIQLGDYYFEQNKFTTAEGYYDKIVAQKDAQLLPYAIYKKGWCAYNMQRTKVALAHLSWVSTTKETRGLP